MLLLLLQEISIHLKYAFESLLGDEQRNKRSRSRSTSHEEISDCLYSVNEAKSIAELTAKVIKSLVDSDTTLFIVMECPQVTVRPITYVGQKRLTTTSVFFSLGVPVQVLNPDELEGLFSPSHGVD